MLSSNFIEGMIIAAAMVIELKQFKINYQNWNDHICI